MNKIEYIGVEKDKDGKDIHVYNYKFTSGYLELDVDDGTTYGGINFHAESVALTAEQFKWNVIRYAYKYDTNTPEGLHAFMTKCDPNYKTTLEELKESWNALDDLDYLK